MQHELYGRSPPLALIELVGTLQRVGSVRALSTPSDALHASAPSKSPHAAIARTSTPTPARTSTPHPAPTSDESDRSVTILPQSDSSGGVHACLTVDMDYDALVNDSSKLAKFKTDIASEMARELRKPFSEIHITSLRAGSTIVDVLIEENDPARAAALEGRIRSGLFSKQVGRYSVKAVEVSIVKPSSTGDIYLFRAGGWEFRETVPLPLLSGTPPQEPLGGWQCEFGCGFEGTFEQCGEHQLGCKLRAEEGPADPTSGKERTVAAKQPEEKRTAQQWEVLRAM